jgi:hypothetical protein
MRVALIFLLAAAAVVAPHNNLRAATPDEVQNAIDNGVQYLYTQQRADNWDHSKRNHRTEAKVVDQSGGATATVIYALLSAGERADTPKLAAAIHDLLSTDYASVYTLGMRCQIWRMLLPDDQIRQALRKDGMRLVQSITPDGIYTLRVPEIPGVRPDYSASQYGILGAWAYAQEGMEVPTNYWQTVDQGWRSAQKTDGSWNYGKATDLPATLPMTAAGLATLFIAQDELSAGTSPSCKGNIVDDAINRGIDWLGENFAKVFNSKYQNYALYQIEELGAASGRKYLGSTDWYAQGSDFLVRNQKSDGSWNANSVDTAFALLFLARGRAPVGMNKLQYFSGDAGAGEGNWNQRPRDLANFDRWIGRQVELDRLLNWQVVNLSAQAADLHDASILYIAGDKALSISDADKQKLKTFIQQGGMIFFNADCGSSEFTDSVKKLAAELFPDIGEFREISPDHCMLKNEQFLASQWQDPPTILGLSNGVRELMVLIPKADVSRAWQAQLSSSHESLFEFGADLLLYATDKQNIREKGQSFILKPSPSIAATRSIKIGRLKYDGMWNPEPGGWTRLAAVMHNRDQLDLNVVPVTLSTNADLTDFKIIHITGSQHIKLSIDQWIQLHSYVHNGGTLIIDAAGGSQKFNDDMHQQLQNSFFDQVVRLDEPLRPTHALYTQFGSRIDEVSYRNFARHVLMENLRVPRIRGLKMGDRIGVFYSAEDISGGLVGEPVDGIIGYSPDSATALMEHMILYAEAGGKTASNAGEPSGGADQSPGTGGSGN